MSFAQGVHAMPAEQYHSDPCPEPSLSNSLLKTLLSESCRKAWHSHPRLNPNYREEHDGKFDLGTCAHAVLLEDDAGNIAVIDPQNYPSKQGGIPKGWTNNAIRAARDAARTKGRVPLLATVYDDVRRMVDAAREFLTKGETADYWLESTPEKTGIWQEDGVWMRCRFDKITPDLQFIHDYKSTTDVSPDGFSRQIVRMGYHIQDAFYRRGARALGAKAPQFVMLAQSVEEPHECSLHACHPALQEIADMEVERAIGLWRQCVRTKQWPSYSGRIHYAMPTSYMLTEHEMRLQEAA